MEISNFTGHSVNLNDYNLRVQFEGETSYYFPSPLELEGFENETLVVLNPRASFSCFDSQQAKFLSTAPIMTFNGTNYVELRYKYFTIDALGSKDLNNFDNLENISLYRLSSIKEPNFTFNINEWQKNPSDYCEGLGSLSIKNLVETSSSGLKIYPNPVTDGLVYFEGDELSKIKQIQIIDFSGNMILNANNSFQNKNFINIKGLKSGIYILKTNLKSFKLIIK